MIRHIILDSPLVGSITHPNPGVEARKVVNWVTSCRAAGHVFYLSGADYEVRRELIRAGKTAGIRMLDVTKSTMTYMPISTDGMLLAADLWAQARRGGYPTGNPDRLDADVILAAHSRLRLPYIPAGSLVIATTNVRHLSRFVPAEEWQNIKP